MSAGPNWYFAFNNGVRSFSVPAAIGGYAIRMFDDVNKFIELSAKIDDLASLSSLVEEVSRDMGFSYYSIVQQQKKPSTYGSWSSIYLQNYPEAWVQRFDDVENFINDPVHLASLRTGVGFRWNEIDKLMPVTHDHRFVFQEAGKNGLGDGLSIPNHMPNEMSGLCSFAVETHQEIPKHIFPMAQLVGNFSYDAARRIWALEQKDKPDQDRVKLTQRQVECILLIAKGKTDWEISRILGLAEDTVTEHIKNARLRYDVARRSQLVIRALNDGYFTLNDALG